MAADLSEDRLSARDGWLVFAGALALRAAAFRAGLPPAPPEALLTGPEAGPALFVLRLAATLGSSLAAVLVARAGARLGGRAGGLGAGWLLALTAFAVRNAAWGGAPVVLILASSGASLAWVRWSRERRPVDLAGLALWGAVGAWGLRIAPLTTLADPDVLSPLGEGLLRTARIAGPATAALALAGVAAAVRSRDPAARGVAVGTGLLVLLVLVRQGADPNSLAAAIPGVALLAAYAAARPRDVFAGVPARIGPAALGVALLVALGTSARVIAVSRGASPARDAERWILAHVPEGIPVLTDEAGLDLPRIDPVAGTRGFEPVRIPPPGVRPPESDLFYSVDLARRFPLLVLRDPPASASEVRRGFWKFFRDEWHEGFRTGEGEYPLSAVTVLARPDDWQPDSARIAQVDAEIRTGPLKAALRTSQAYSDWILDATKAMRAAGNLVEAQSLVDLSMQRGDLRAEVFFEQGLLYVLTEQWGPAMSSMIDALDRDPRHGGAHFNLGTLLEREGDLDGAETEYRAAVVSLADPVPAHARLGELLAARGRVEEAEDELDRVRRLRPGGQEQAYLEQAIRKAREGGS